MQIIDFYFLQRQKQFLFMFVRNAVRFVSSEWWQQTLQLAEQQHEEFEAVTMLATGRHGINSERQLFDRSFLCTETLETHNWKYRSFGVRCFSNLHVDNFSWISVHNYIPTIGCFSIIQDYLSCHSLKFSLKSCEDHVALQWLQEVKLDAAPSPHCLCLSPP